MTSSLQTLIRDLGRRRGRERRGLAVAEGVRLVEEALAAGATLKGAVISPALEGSARGEALKAALAAALAATGVRLEEVGEAELQALADTEHPQGVLVVFQPKAWRFEDIPARPGSVILVLDGVQDPGNVGTMLRTAWALGAAGVVALKGTADVTNSKVVRGSMGAIFRLPTVPGTPDDFLAWARREQVAVWVTAADAAPVGRPAGSRSDRPAVALVVGNEGAGVGAALLAAAARRVGIRLAPGAESLNVAVAAGILLHEVSRDD